MSAATDVTKTSDRADDLPVARLAGDPYRLGLGHGRALARQLRFLHYHLHASVICRRGRLVGWALLGLIRTRVARMEPHIPARLRAEAQGVADGAGVPYRDILLLNCFDDAIHNLQAVVPMGRLACSAFSVQGPRAPASGLLLARNLDYYPEVDWWGVGRLINDVLRQTVVIFVTRPSQRYAFLSIGWPGFVGAVTGLNEAGLALACLTSTVPGETADGEPTLLLYRRILEEAATLDEAESLLRAARRTIGNNLLIASARDGAARLIEFTPQAIAAVEPTNGVLATTNHFQHPTASATQRGWVIPNSVVRLQRLRTLCQEAVVEAEHAQAILGDHVATADMNCLFNRGTVYSAIIAPLQHRVWLRGAGDGQAGFRTYEAAAMLTGD